MKFIERKEFLKEKNSKLKEIILEFMRQLQYKPMTLVELHQGLVDAGVCVEDGKSSDDLRAGEVTRDEGRACLPIAIKDVKTALVELEADVLVIKTRADTYGLPEQFNLRLGRVQAHAKGFCFVMSLDKSYDDIYVAAENVGTAMHKDKVLVRLSQPKKGSNNGRGIARPDRQEGQIIRIVERANKEIVGTFFASKSYGFVVADDKRLAARDIFIAKDDINGAEDGYKVVVEITSYPEGRMSAEGKVIEVLGHINEPGVDILSIIRKHGIPEAFPDQVMTEADLVPDQISKSELEGRADYRDWRTFTIDGEDAKDLDDALSIVRLDNGNFKLGVHIADVSYYVKEGSAIDLEARQRGNSTYLIDRVIPMLPERLSNGICSLNPRVDRLTMSCVMEVNPAGQVVDYELGPSVIRTSERMTYSNVRKVIEDRDQETMDRYPDLVDDFFLLQELQEVLLARRINRGALNLEIDEAKVIVDLDSKPIDIVLRERSQAEQIIEECMLLANETVAEHIYHLDLPMIYRVHEDPDSTKLALLNDFVYHFGYHIKGATSDQKVHPRAIQDLIKAVSGHPEGRIINTVLLRSMKQAHYGVINVGHFGLAAKYYTHFTSPIRRYSDLTVHRLIRKIPKMQKMSEDKREDLTFQLLDIAETASERERVSIDAEREVDELKKVQYMDQHVGEEFDAIITSVTNFGMFVELDNTVEGLVHISFLVDDYYNYNEATFSLVGERTRKVYRIGDEVRVKLMKANVEERNLDFTVISSKRQEQKVATRKPKPIQVTATGKLKTSKKKKRESQLKDKGKPRRAKTDNKDSKGGGQDGQRKRDKNSRKK